MLTKTTGNSTESNKGLLYLLLGFFVPALVSLIGYMVIKVWPFGNGTVLIIDSIHQYLPFYTDFHEKLVSGDSLFYSFSGGFGYDFWSTFAYYLASPLNFLIALVPTKNVCDFMDYMILFKIGLCGATFSWYLYKRDPKKPYLPVVFASMYALGNFIIGYYFNLMWLDSIAMLPLIMYGIERLVAGKGGRVYGLALFYSIWCNYYIGFMLCIFSCLYLVIAILEKKGLTMKKILGRLCIFGWYSLLGGGMASLVLVPAFVSLLSSESMQGNHFPTTIKFYTDFVHMVLTHFAAEHPINISDSQVGLNAYCGVAVMIFFLLYVQDEKIAFKVKLGRIALLGLLMLSFSMNMLNYIWHGLHTQNGLPNRFAFIYVCLLLVLCYDVMGHIRSMHIWQILLAGLIPICFSVAAILLEVTDWETYGAWNYLTPVLLLIYLMALLTIYYLKMKKKAAYGLLGVLLLAEAVSHGIYGFKYNDNVTRNIYLEDQASYRNMMKEIGDTGFYRSEIDRQRMRNVTMFAGGHSTVLFNSTMSASITDFCDRLGIEARTNKNGYIGETRLMNDIFGIRYVLSPEGKEASDTLYSFPKIMEDDNLSVYKNDNALSIGFLVNEEILDWELEDEKPIENQNAFVRLAAGMDDIYTYDRKIEAEDSMNYQVKIPDDKQVYLYMTDRIEKIELHTPEYNKNYSNYTDHLYVINASGDQHMADFTTTLKKSQDTVDVKVYTCPNAEYKKVRDYLAQNQLENVVVTGNSLTGAIHADRDGVLFLSVPIDDDWTVTVDGEETEVYPIAGAMMGIRLRAGAHALSMKYEPAGMKLGLILSLVTLVLFLITSTLENKMLKKLAADLESRRQIYLEKKRFEQEWQENHRFEEAFANERKDN